MEGLALAHGVGAWHGSMAWEHGMAGNVICKLRHVAALSRLDGTAFGAKKSDNGAGSKHSPEAKMQFW